MQTELIPRAASTPQAQKPSGNAALKSLKDLALGFQGTDERISEAQAKLIPDAIRACEHWLAPAGLKALAVQLDRLFEFAAAFGINADRTKAAKFYAPLANLPDDLLAKAIDRVIATKPDGYRLPLPIEIDKAVAEDLALRRRVLGGLQRMSRASVDRKIKRTPEEIAQVAAAVAKAREALEAGGAALRGDQTSQRPAQPDCDPVGERGSE